MSDKQDPKHELNPKLRFPGFTDSWHYRELGPQLKEHFERVPSNTKLPIYSSTRSGLKPQRDYYDGRELTNDGEYGVVPCGYFVYRHMSDDGIFKFNINKTGQKIAVSKEYPVFTTVDLSSDFLLHALNDGDDFKRFAVMQKKGGTRTRLYFSTLRSWSLPLPSHREQLKIAECLSSIDELIAAEAQKLDALKIHKNGLMQQLFPAQGEVVPRLRFPEFRDAGEWEAKYIRDLGEIVTGNTPSTTKPEFYGGERLFVSPADISDDRFIKETKITLTEVGFSQTRPIKSGSILFVCIGSIGKIAQNLFECATNQQINSIIPSPDHSSGFIYYALEKSAPEISELAGKQVVPIVNKTTFGSFEVIFPKLPEQQRIADCFSSIDELITAHSRKIDILKVHKKGLMQQLFPTLDEVHG